MIPYHKKLMKSKRTLLILTLIILGSLVLSACAGAVQSSSWPGVTVGDEAIYVTYNQHVYAVNPENGIEMHRFPIEAIRGATFYAPAALDTDERMVVGGYNKILYGAQNGLQTWSFEEAKSPYVAGAVIKDGLVYAPNADAWLYVLDSNGILQWKYESGHALWAAPLFNGEVLYLASMDHHIYSLDKMTGEVIWETEDLGGAIVDTPTQGEDGILYVGTFGNEVLAIDSRNGEVIKRFETSQWVWSSPLLYEGRLYFGDLDGNFYAIDADTFQQVWSIQPETVDKRQIIGKPLAVNGKIYFGSETGNLFTVDPDNGSLLNTRTIGGKILAGPISTGDLILVAPNDFDSPLIALDENGNQRWAFVPGK